MNGGFNSVWRTATNIHSTRNASGKFTAGDYRAVKAALADRTLPHSIVTRANDAAHIIHALDGGMADAIFNDALETTGKCTDLTLAAVITDDNTLFNGAVANGRDKGGTGSGKAVHIIIHLCADQAGFEGFGAGFQRHIFNDDRKGVAACKADTVKTIYQTVAVDLFTVDVQVLDRGVLNIGQQRLSTFGNSQKFAVTEDRSGKCTKIVLFARFSRIEFIGPIHRTSDRCPIIRVISFSKRK